MENEEYTNNDEICSKCDGIMKEASFEILNSLSVDFGHDLLIGPKKVFYLNPRRRSSVRVIVCKKCGFVEIYAENPEGL